MSEEIELVKWQLLELANQDPDLIESNDFEIYGEDEHGRDGVCTVKITDLARGAYDRIVALEKVLNLYAKYENKKAMERDIRLLTTNK